MLISGCYVCTKNFDTEYSVPKLKATASTAVRILHYADGLSCLSYHHVQMSKYLAIVPL